MHLKAVMSKVAYAHGGYDGWNLDRKLVVVNLEMVDVVVVDWEKSTIGTKFQLHRELTNSHGNNEM